MNPGHLRSKLESALRDLFVTNNEGSKLYMEIPLMDWDKRERDLNK